MSSARTRGTGAGAGRSGAAAVDAKVQRRTCDARRDDRPMDATPFFIPLISVFFVPEVRELDAA